MQVFILIQRAVEEIPCQNKMSPGAFYDKSVFEMFVLFDLTRPMLKTT